MTDVARRKHINPDKYEGTSTELREYLNHFLIVMEVNKWGEEEQGLYLVGRLTGAARGVLNYLSPTERKNFPCLKSKLQQRFEPACRKEAFCVELRGCQRRKSETPAEFGHAIKKLVSKIYLHLDERAKETIAMAAIWNCHPEGDMRAMALMRSPGN